MGFNLQSSKVSSNGQTVIPDDIRKKLGLNQDGEILWEFDESGQLTVKKVPTASDWDTLIERINIPAERVKMDGNGHYDPERSPVFHEWMVNG